MSGTSIKWLVIIVTFTLLLRASFPAVQGTSSISTVVYDAATNQPISGPLALHTTVYDTATLTHSAGPTPAGTVTYTFFRSGDCTTGTVVGSPQVVTLSPDGSIPHSADHGPLTAADGPYAFKAVFSGDGNYTGAVSACEPLEVGQGTTSVTTIIYDASTNQPAPGLLPLNSTVYDTTVVHHAGGPTPTGTVTYTFYRSGTCTSGTVAGTQVVTLNANGSVPNSADHGPLTAADSPYAFNVVYSGDSNYTGGASDCEPFAVGKGSTSLSTSIYDAFTNQPITGQLPLDATVYDTSTLSHPAGPLPTGTVVYTFYKSGDCTTGTITGTPQVVTLNPDGSVPHSADHGPLVAADGPYAFQAVYTGDANYLAGASGCEPFAVGQGQTSVTTIIYDASTGQPAPALLPFNSTVYDTSVVHHSGGPTPTGTVTYIFYKQGTCTSGTVAGTQTVTLNSDGTVPKSNNFGPLAVADSPYAFKAVYSGDANYIGGVSDCEGVLVATPINIYLPMVGKQ